MFLIIGSSCQSVYSDFFSAPLSPMIDGLNSTELGLNEKGLDQNAPDFGSKNLEDKMTKMTN